MNIQPTAETEEQRIILITGCSSGIGAATAHLLRGLGWRVFASARKTADVEALRDDGFEALQLDYCAPASIDAAVEALQAATGNRLDAVFNNGAIGFPCALEDTPEAALRELFEANFFGWHRLTRHIVPLMRRQGSGRIIQCSSVLGFVALKFRGAYNASKYAIEGYSDTLRLELRGSGIFVTLIEPGPIATQFSANSRANFHRLIETNALKQSAFQTIYRRYIDKSAPDSGSRFRLPAEAVAQKVRIALDARQPRARYRITVPTSLFAYAKRSLSTRQLDRLLARISDAGT